MGRGRAKLGRRRRRLIWLERCRRRWPLVRSRLLLYPSISSKLTQLHPGTSTALPVRPRAEPFPELAPVPSFSPSRHSSASNHPSAAIRVLHSITSFLRSLVSPPTVALLSGLIIAIVPNLKALFYYTDDTSFHPTAPDGDPPLSIIYQTALFIGNASVPLGLFVLGASMAKMVIPRPISRLPIAGEFGL